MPTSFKPATYTSVSPYHVVQGADRYIAFLEQVFGAEQLRRYTYEGKVVHAEMRIDDTVLMLADANEQYGPNKPLTHIYVPDVDDLYQRALAAGCTSNGEPQTRPDDPDRRGGFTDPFGNGWSIATQIETVH